MRVCMFVCVVCVCVCVCVIAESSKTEITCENAALRPVREESVLLKKKVFPIFQQNGKAYQQQSV